MFSIDVMCNMKAKRETRLKNERNKLIHLFLVPNRIKQGFK